jgi:hypothetical protein
VPPRGSVPRAGRSHTARVGVGPVLRLARRKAASLGHLPPVACRSLGQGLAPGVPALCLPLRVVLVVRHGSRPPNGIEAGRLTAMYGTVKPRQRTDAPDHARELEEIVLSDYKGVSVRLGDLWRDRPAVLVFLRHYG